MIRLSSKQHSEPYKALAPIYDDVMQHVDYKRWAAYIHDIITRYAPESRWVVDISCGTGTFCSYLERHGYTLTGMDNSAPMLKEAVRKQPNRHQFVCADVCRLPLAENPDIIVSLYDSMNYLMTDELWHKSFVDVYRTLKDGGLFIFDVSTVRNSKIDFSRYVEKEKFANGSYLRKSQFDKKNNIQINNFEIKLAQHPKVIFCETHQQRIRPLAEIVSFIDASPFTFIAGLKDFSFQPYNESCERAHFVLGK